MATQTTNLGLIKPAGTDKIRIAQINGNMDILDEKIGAVGNTSLQSQVTTNTTAIAKLDSNTNKTNDILADAVSATASTFFRGGGSTYTGTLPTGSGLAYGSFWVNLRATSRFVIGVSNSNTVYTNVYDGSSWSNWEKLAKDEEKAGKVTFGTVAANSSSEFTVTSGERLLVIAFGNNAVRIGAWILHVGSSGAVTSVAIVAGSSLTLTDGTNKFTIANSSNSATYVYGLLFVN